MWAASSCHVAVFVWPCCHGFRLGPGRSVLPLLSVAPVERSPHVSGNVLQVENVLCDSKSSTLKTSFADFIHALSPGQPTPKLSSRANSQPVYRDRSKPTGKKKKKNGKKLCSYPRRPTPPHSLSFKTHFSVTCIYIFLPFFFL